VFNGPYVEWNQKRIKAIVEYYGHQFFLKKKILDLGCGHGDISGVLHRLGSDVTAVDARQDHLKMVGKKYNGVKTVRADLDQSWPFHNKTFDLTLDLALLFHLNNFEEHLKAVCASSNYLVLETAILDSDDPNACLVRPDNKNAYDGSFNGFSSQVSAANIERVLTQCGMNFQRLDKVKFNSTPYVYDWHSRNDKSFDINKRRIWFCIRQGNQTIEVNTQPVNILPAIHGGNNNTPRLTDSKTGIQYRAPITASPAAPPHPRPAAPVEVFAASLSVPKVSHKIRLFYNYYEDRDASTRSNISLCLKRNIDNQLFDVIIIESENAPTFDFMFEKINRLSGPNDISIICNTDIFFDGSIALADRISDKEVYALSRWEWANDRNSTLPDQNIQSVWVIKGKIENVVGNFQMGRPGSDGRIAYELERAGYKVTNPSKSIKTYHIHNGQPKRYTEKDRVPGDYLYVPIVNL
jgi:SAM-dependent methyltransferase